MCNQKRRIRLVLHHIIVALYKPHSLLFCQPFCVSPLHLSSEGAWYVHYNQMRWHHGSSMQAPSSAAWRPIRFAPTHTATILPWHEYPRHSTSSCARSAMRATFFSMSCFKICSFATFNQRTVVTYQESQGRTHRPPDEELHTLQHCKKYHAQHYDYCSRCNDGPITTTAHMFTHAHMLICSHMHTCTSAAFLPPKSIK